MHVRLHADGASGVLLKVEALRLDERHLVRVRVRVRIGVGVRVRVRVRVCKHAGELVVRIAEYVGGTWRKRGRVIR